MALYILKVFEITCAREVLNNVTAKPIIDNVTFFPCHSWVDEDSDGEQEFPLAFPILPNHCSLKEPLF